jgi:ABC-type transport system involved in multi-copper enzyme maturation permease subunit
MSEHRADISDTLPAAAAYDATLSAARTSSLARIAAIARNAFREAVRDRVLYNLVLFVLLLTAAAVFLGELSASQEAKIITDLGLSAMLLFGVFIAIFVGTGLVYKEIERRTIYAIFSKPVGRGEFLIGKYLGLALTLLVNVLVMSAGVALALFYAKGGYDANIGALPGAIALIYLQLLILTAVALLFSTFSSPTLSALLSLLVFIIGHFSADMLTFAETMKSASAHYLFTALYYLLPNLSKFSFITAAAHGRSPSINEFTIATLYAVAYILALLAAATLIFNRRNFK